MRSSARILYEVEKRLGRLSEAPQFETALYAGWLMDGGDPADEAGFQAYIDSGVDLAALNEQLEEIMGDPTTGDATQSSRSPSLSPDSGGSPPSKSSTSPTT